MPDVKKTAMTANWNDYSYTRAIAALSVVGDPDIVLQQLGKPRYSLRVLETDDEISAALETRREAVLGTSWNLVGDDQQRTEQVRKVLEYWLDDILRGAWNAAPYGYSVLRAGWSGGNRPQLHPEFGIVAPVWIGEWPMEQFVVTADGGMKYKRMDTGEFVPADAPEFFLTRRNATWRNPYGESLLSRLYWPWFFRYNGWRFWMQFVERYGDPLITGQVNSPAEFVKAAQANGFASVMAVHTEENLNVASQTGDGHQRLIAELDRRIQKVILGQTLTTSTDGKGSYAAAKVHNEVRQDKRLADLRLVRRTVQQVVDWIWRLNGWEGLPSRFEFDAGVSITQEKASALKDLKDAGWQAQEQLLGRIFGDVKPGDFEQVATTAMAGQNGNSSLALAASGSNGRFTPAQQGIEELVDASIADMASPIPPDELRKLIAKAKSPEHLDELLAAKAVDADPVAYREMLERALFAADVFGYVKADQREV